MNKYLSNTMPELSEHELKSRGNYTVSYFDKKIMGYVASGYCSLYLFLHMVGLKNTIDNRNIVIAGIIDDGYFAKNDIDDREVTIH